jgi:hypothetical protein
VGRDTSKVDLHEGNELEPSKMHFMYDRAFGDIVYGQIKGLTPYYKMLNTLFRFTLTPRGGDSDKISSRAKNLLAQMAPDRPKFAVMEFIWHEIIACSSDPSSACHYAPYVFHMIKVATQLNIVPNITHMAYRSNKGKIEQTLHIASHSTGIPASGPFPGAYASNFTPGASSSRAAPPSPTGPSTSRRARLPSQSKASYPLLLKGFLLALICVTKMHMKCENIGDIWMRNSSRWKGSKRN